ncbi:hypothetical protein [Hymenobacter coccineus]|uniref:hypothetical protein n=1 Tax=Hymenobacter coccineus TaxID=1908235 RepID=UPI000F787E29|nr:hypothetical protein [Hymenobacter coccineus]
MLHFILRRLLPLVVLVSLGLSSCVVREPRRGYGYGRHDQYDDHHGRHDHHDRYGRYSRH